MYDKFPLHETGLVKKPKKKYGNYISRNELTEVTGLSLSSIWRYQQSNKFPKKRKLFKNKYAWVLSEVEEWMIKYNIVKREQDE